MAGVTLLHKAKRGEELLRACEAGNILECSKLIERDGVPANMCDDTRFATPLMVAAANSQDKIVKFLIAKNANPFAKDAAGWTALTWACWGAGAKKARGWCPGKSKQTIEAIVQRMTIDFTKNEERNKLGGIESLLNTTHSGYTPLMMYVKHFGKKVDRGAAKKGAKTTKAEVLKEQLAVIPKLIPFDKLLARKLACHRSFFGETAIQLARGKNEVKEIRKAIETVLRDLKISEQQQKDDLVHGVDPPAQEESKDAPTDALTANEKSKLLAGGADSDEPSMLYCFTGGRK